MKIKKCYQMPTAEVVRMKMEARLLAESQSWPAGVPVYAQRNGYESTESEVW